MVVLYSALSRLFWLDHILWSPMLSVAPCMLCKDIIFGTLLSSLSTIRASINVSCSGVCVSRRPLALDHETHSPIRTRVLLQDSVVNPSFPTPNTRRWPVVLGISSAASATVLLLGQRPMLDVVKIVVPLRTASVVRKTFCSLVVRG